MAKNEAKNISHILELSYLQEIQDSLGKITKITLGILDQQGLPVTNPTNLFAFCEVMQKNEVGVNMCIKTNSELLKTAKETKKIATLKCPNSGLFTALIPIFFKDLFLGGWIVGQMRTENIDEGILLNTAAKIGMPLKTAVEKVNSLPLITKSRFENILEFLQLITSEIIKFAEANDALNSKNSELLDLSEKLRASLNTFSEFIDLSDVGVFVTDFHSNEMLLQNSVYRALLEADETLSLSDKKNRKKAKNASPSLSELLTFYPKELLLFEDGTAGEAIIWESRIESLDIWLRVTSRAIRWIDGSLAHMATFVDITDRKKQEEKIAYLAYYDQRLCIPNGTKLFSDLDNISYPAHLLFFDIHGLRKINDAYSRKAGDELLNAIKSFILEQNNPHISELYRIDGDAFAILLRDVSQKEAKEIADYIYTRFDNPFIINFSDMTRSIFTSISLGALAIDHSFADYGSFLNVIERILGAARNYKAPFYYTGEIGEKLDRRLKLELSLKECILNGMQGFSISYQPIVDPLSGVWVGLEALCRWESPEFGPISPALFIPDVEQLGLIDLLGAWILRESVSQVKKWHLDLVEPFTLDVNLSPLQFLCKDLSLIVSNILKEYDYPPHKLSLEVTESAEVNFTTTMTNSLEELKALGISLSLDDFGTGYATFSTLKSLPVSIIKTDRSFMQSLEEDSYSQHTVSIIVDFAHAAGMKVIAEGVETDIQRQILVQSGVDFFQGYYFSKPLSADEIFHSLSRFKNASGVSLPTYSDISISALSDPEGGYILALPMYQLLGHVLYILTNEPNLKKALESVLCLIGKSFSLNHLFIIQTAECGSPDFTCEWNDSRFASNLPVYRHFASRELCQSTFRNNGFISSCNRDYIDTLLEGLSPASPIHSFCMFPLTKNGRQLGIFGVDECTQEKIKVSHEEAQFLYYVNSLLSMRLSQNYDCAERESEIPPLKA